jgi:hypothetical protein
LVPLTGTVLTVRIASVERGKLLELRVQFDHDPPRLMDERAIRPFTIVGK